MNVLLVYPRHPDTFWSFRHALKFVSKKASDPPLGLITIAPLLPAEWNRKLVDLNVTKLRDKDLRWADYVFISAMSIQRDSVDEILSRCREMGKKIVAGGPLFSAHPEDYADRVDHLVLNEAEITLPLFLDDLARNVAKSRYSSEVFADVLTSPIPDWSLLSTTKYATMDIQYSRGCPFSCDFCDVTVLFGRSPRTKSAPQVVAELESLYRRGWRGGVFFVDDNFIGNKRKLRDEVLPAIIEWMDYRRRPFSFYTEASIDLADDDALTSQMVRAGFDTVFIGIESPNDASLQECRKGQNRERDLLANVKKLQQRGLQVQGGFIVGFDNDPASIFDNVSEFIQKSGIVSAMVGLLNAPRGTKLYQRLQSEGRILNEMAGNNTSASLNFIPKMDAQVLVEEYRKLVENLYTPRHYYARIRKFLREYRRPPAKSMRMEWRDVSALSKSTFFLGVLGKERFHYWHLFFWSLFTRPRSFPLAMTFAIYGFHFRKIAETMSIH